MSVSGVGSSVHPPGHRHQRDANLHMWTIAWLRRGITTFTTDHGQCRLGPARLVAIAPRTAYVTTAPGVTETWWFVSPPLTMPDLPQVLPGIFSLRLLDLRLRRAVRDLDRSTTAELRENAWERIQLLVRPVAGSHPAVRAALAHLRAHLDQAHGLASLAQTVGCSRSRLAEVFVVETGVPPMAWLAHERLERAKHLLLTTTLDVGEIATQVGYPNPFHFSTRFKSVTGSPPSHWRQAHTQPPPMKPARKAPPKRR